VNITISINYSTHATTEVIICRGDREYSIIEKCIDSYVKRTRLRAKQKEERENKMLLEVEKEYFRLKGEEGEND
jgi:soluble P-type ATPase